MKKRNLIVIVLILGVINNCFCCLMASQERIIPIGTDEGCLIGIEIISNRYDGKQAGNNPLWKFQFTLKGFNDDYSDYPISKSSVIKEVEENKIKQLLNSKITQAIAVCKKLENFNFFTPKQIEFCDFKKNCSSAKLIEQRGKLNLKIDNINKTFPIKYLDNDYIGQIAKPYKEYFQFYFDDTKEIIGSDLKISSSRNYENSDFTLLIFHLATGQETENNRLKGKTNNKKHGKTKVKDPEAAFIEPVLHHGKGFDYFIITRK